MASIKTPFKEAEDFLRSKVPMSSRTWNDLTHGEHARGFVSAGVMKSALLEDLHQAVIKAVEGGLTRQQFRAQFDQILAGRGWPFNQPDSKGYRDWRAGVIYDTNLRMAYQSGHWKQMQKTADSRPYLEYSAILDGKTRPLHREWHGTILPIDHPWWKTHYPPNGWNCRCTVVSRSAADLKRLGKAVSVPPPSPLVDATVTINGERRTIQVPEGIDPGFAYNVGEAAWGGYAIEERAKDGWKPMAKFGQIAPSQDDPGPMPAARARPVALAPRLPDFDRTGMTPDEIKSRLTDQLIERIVALTGDPFALTRDPTGEEIMIDAKLLAEHLAKKLANEPENRRERYLPLMLDALRNPTEIWQGFEQLPNGRVRLARRYLAMIADGDGKTMLIRFVTQVLGGVFRSYTFFPQSEVKNLKNLRSGLRIYRQGE
jgi:SPP1 gp7 family putative phage head morphogenesis protein